MIFNEPVSQNTSMFHNNPAYDPRYTLLSKEERDILILISAHPDSQHLSNKEISQQLDIPVTKVKTLIHQACDKLGARNRNEAVFLAMVKREINLDALFSLEELAELFCTLDPDDLRMIAKSVRQNPNRRTPPETFEPVILLDRNQSGLLTNREREVLIMVSCGLSNVEIAEKLCMSTSAVRTFLNRAFKKLGARKRADAVQIALKQKEISICEMSTLDQLVYYLTPLGADTIEEIANLQEKNLGENTDFCCSEFFRKQIVDKS